MPNPTYDEMVDDVYGEHIGRSDGYYTDIMNCREQEEIDVEQIPDCYSREDLLELAAGQRIIEYLEEGEYLYGN